MQKPELVSLWLGFLSVVMFVCAVEELSMSLEDERELVKAVKKKNSNVIKDLQKQLQSCNRCFINLHVCFEAQISCMPILFSRA